MIKSIVAYTNDKEVKPVEEVEIYCYIGLMILIGSFKESDTSISDLWSSK